MLLQILPPDFQYQPETTTLVSKAEIISFVVIAFVLSLFLVFKILKNKKPTIYSELKSAIKFIAAVIQKDLKIN